MRYQLDIPHWRPTPLNQLLAGHWSTKHRMKKSDREMIGVFFRYFEIPRATGKRRVELEIALAPRQKRVDVDAYQKSTLDALVACGALVDDTQDLAEWGGVKYFVGSETHWGTTIILTDLEEIKCAIQANTPSN